jgi:outer membrane protein assembly factor BamB
MKVVLPMKLFAQNLPQVFMTLAAGLAVLGLATACQVQTSDRGVQAKEPAGQATAAPAEVKNLWQRTQGEDWGAFLGPRGDGTSTEKGVDPELWQPHPRLVWQLPLGMSYGGPAVAQGRVLQFDREGRNERLRCLEAETGQLLWKWYDPVEYEDMYGYNNGPRCMPIVDGDRVYVYGVAGKLSCVTLADGQTLWQRDLAKEFGVVQNFFGVASTPCIWGDRLLVMVGGSPAESQRVPSGRLDLVKPNGSAILALDKRTGKEIYRVGDELASYSSPLVRRIGQRDLGLAFVRGGLLAWDVADGKQEFMFPWRASNLESVNAAQPVVSGNQIFISETYEIGSALLEVDDGEAKVVWKDGDHRSDQAFRAHWSTPALIDGYLYGCSGRNQPDSDFRCVRWSDRQVMWTERRHERASVLAVDGYLIVLYENGELELVRPSTEKYDLVRSVDLATIRDGSELASQPVLTDDPYWAPPVLAHGLLFIRGNSRLLCLDLIPAP